MIVILEPKIHVLATPQFHPHGLHEIPDDGSDFLKIGAFAAKGCYDAFSKTGRANEANQLAVMEHGHGSVLEHLNVTLFVEGISRALSLELNRHRGIAISQRSTRYVDEDAGAIVLDPYYAANYSDIASSGEVDAFLDSCEASLEAYRKEVERLMTANPLGLGGTQLRKWARGKARNLLPHALETSVTYTMNLRTVRWLIECRTDEHAESEIRRFAHVLYTTLKPLVTPYLDDFTEVSSFEGIPVLKPSYRKV